MTEMLQNVQMCIGYIVKTYTQHYQTFCFFYMQKIIVCIKDFSFSLLTVFNNHVLCILCKEPCTLLLTHS